MIRDGLDISLRPAVADDDEFLRDLFFDVRRDEFEAAGFPAEQLKPLLAMQYIAQKRSYESGFPNAAHRIITLEGVSVGRILTAGNAQSMHLIDISLLRDVRGRGIGGFLINDLQKNNAAVTLNVFKNNSGAIRLYERLGFGFVNDDGAYHQMEWKNA